MRPLKKQDAGHVFDNGAVVLSKYQNHRDAFDALFQNLDNYCAYCEVFTADLHVEHIISKDQDPAKELDWYNFLLSCPRCNGRDNKGSKPIDFNAVYYPHINNTLFALKYREGGFVEANDTLAPPQKEKAEALIDLLGLDKYPFNPKYPHGFASGDRRWDFRREAWELAQSKLKDYQNGILTANNIAEYARQRGFFSVWFNVFDIHIDVKKALVEAFRGTDHDSFNEHFDPIPRNPLCTADPI